jgi:hypothetical protein
MCSTTSAFLFPVSEQMRNAMIEANQTVELARTKPMSAAASGNGD